MTAFDNHLKQRGMPNVTNKTTIELLQQIQEGFLTQPQSDALNELFAREIKTGDSDANSKVVGGIRPEHAPRN